MLFFEGMFVATETAEASEKAEASEGAEPVGAGDGADAT